MNEEELKEVEELKARINTYRATINYWRGRVIDHLDPMTCQWCGKITVVKEEDTWLRRLIRRRLKI